MDYKAIIEKIDEEEIKRILDKLEIPWIDRGNYLLCRTGCHNVDIENASWKLYYYKDNHLFYCYSNCFGMNIFKFLENYYESRGIIYDWFQDILNFILSYTGERFGEETNLSKYKSNRDRYLIRKQRRELPTYPNGIIDVFIKEYPVEWINEGITENTMDKFNIRYSSSQNKIIIPHYDVNNNLVGIRGRALNEWEAENIGKYMPVQIEGKWYSHPLSLNLYGLNLNKENIKENGICYVYEAEKSVMLMEEFSTPNCAVAVCGSQFNKYQLDLLMRYSQPREVVLCFDNEEIDRNSIYFDKLYKICNKYKNYCNMSFIYDRDGLTKLKDSPVDCGETIFKELLERRIKI